MRLGAGIVVLQCGLWLAGCEPSAAATPAVPPALEPAPIERPPIERSNPEEPEPLPPCGQLTPMPVPEPFRVGARPSSGELPRLRTIRAVDPNGAWIASPAGVFYGTEPGGGFVRREPYGGRHVTRDASGLTLHEGEETTPLEGRAARFDRSGDRVVTWDEGGVYARVDGETHAFGALPEGAGTISDVLFSSDGSLLLVASSAAGTPLDPDVAWRQHPSDADLRYALLGRDRSLIRGGVPVGHRAPGGDDPGEVYVARPNGDWQGDRGTVIPARGGVLAQQIMRQGSMLIVRRAQRIEAWHPREGHTHPDACDIGLAAGPIPTGVTYRYGIALESGFWWSEAGRRLEGTVQWHRPGYVVVRRSGSGYVVFTLERGELRERSFRRVPSSRVSAGPLIYLLTEPSALFDVRTGRTRPGWHRRPTVLDAHGRGLFGAGDTLRWVRSGERAPRLPVEPEIVRITRID